MLQYETTDVSEGIDKLIKKMSDLALLVFQRYWLKYEPYV